jgi:hypothetical protein
VLFLYKHKGRIVYSNSEAVLMIHTWIREDVPGLFWIKDFDRMIVERNLATYRNVELDPEQRFRIARLKWLFKVSLDDNDFVAMTKIWKGAQEAAHMLSQLRDQVPAGVALLGLRSRQSTIRNACSEALTRRVQKGEWGIINALYRSHRRSYFKLFFELVINPQTPMPDEGHQRPLAEFRRLQLVVRAQLSEAEAALKALRSMRPRTASLLFGEVVLAIRQGYIGRVLRSIAASSRKRAHPMIIATETVLNDVAFDGLLKLYVKLNEIEIDSEKTPSAARKAEDLARVIRHLTNTQRMAAIRRMFVKIELKPSARDLVVALLTNGDVDDVTTVLVKIASFPHQMNYENHMELCLAAKRALTTSSRETPEIYISWVKSHNFWAYMSKSERSSADVGAVLPLRNQANRPLFVRLLAHTVVALVRSSDDSLLRSLLHHSFMTISTAAAVRMSELIGDVALNAISAEVDEAISERRSSTLASTIRAAQESLYISL